MVESVNASFTSYNIIVTFLSASFSKESLITPETYRESIISPVENTYLKLFKTFSSVLSTTL